MADLIDLTGNKYGKLVVIKKGNGRRTSGGAYKATWICQCECGNITEVDGEKLRRGHTNSCGCFKHENKGSHFEDITGKRFGRLTVIKFIPQEERKARQYDWWCKCDCGNEIKANASKLKTGAQQSCGCLKAEMKNYLGDKTRKYKYSCRRLYIIYKQMLSRCLNSTDKRYGDYGGRGISVCNDWIDNYDTFAEWAFQNGYDEKAKKGVCTLDRIDVDKGYSPDNCRWITNQKQQNNRRNNVYLEYNGKKQSLAEWAREYNIPYGTLYGGIKRYGKKLSDYLNK